MKNRQFLTRIAAISLGLTLSFIGASAPASADTDKHKAPPPKCTKVDSSDPTSKCLILYVEPAPS